MQNSTFALCAHGERRCTPLKVGARFMRVLAQKYLSMLKNIYTLGVSRARLLYIQIRSMRVSGAFSSL